MGNKLNKKKTKKQQYYILLQNTIKKTYDKNRYNSFNQAYSLHSNKFNARRQSTKLFFDENSENNIDWKYYLLQRLEPSPNEHNWRKSFYNYLTKENFSNQYIYQNRIFFQEFSFITKPKSNKKEENTSSLISEPILSSLDTKELKSLSRSLPSFCINPSLVESEMNINVNGKSLEINNDYDQHLTMNISMESITSSMVNKDPKYEAQLNSFKIRKYIQIIKKHLDDKMHPINVIIHEFMKNFTPYLLLATKYCENNKNDKKACLSKGKEIIKHIQYFIETMQVVVKLFYSRSINYRYFIDEKDEIINLISYILFNMQNIYKNVSKIFYYMNYDNIEKLSSQFKRIGDLTPTDIGINPKFCLDKVTDDLMKQLKDNKYNINVNINKDNKIYQSNTTRKISKIVLFFESYNNNQDNDNEQNINNDIENNLDIQEEDIKTEKNEKIGSLYNFYDNEEEKKISTFKLDDFRKNVDSYQDEMNIKELLLNNIEEGYFPSLPKYPEYNDNSKEPYLNAINYLRQIDSYKVPLEKLTVIALISVIITDCVDKYWDSMKNNLAKKYLNIDADELMSIYLYIIYKLNMPSLYVHLDFIKYFTTPISKRSMIGYYYTALEGCLNFILNMKDKNSLTKK